MVQFCVGIQESQFWKLYKEDQPSCSIVMRTSVGLVHLLACLLEPFMPSFSVEVIYFGCRSVCIYIVLYMTVILY